MKKKKAAWDAEIQAMLLKYVINSWKNEGKQVTCKQGTLYLAITSRTKFPWSKSADFGVDTKTTCHYVKLKGVNLLGVTSSSDFTALGVVCVDVKESTLNFQNKAYMTIHERQQLHDAEHLEVDDEDQWKEKCLTFSVLFTGDPILPYEAEIII